VERLGIALEPEADYEKRRTDGGGTEDPRITYVEQLQHFIMTYNGYPTDGPRIAIARPKDLFHWDRLRLVFNYPMNISLSTESIIKMRLYFHSPFQARKVIRLWGYYTGHYFRVPGLKKRFAVHGIRRWTNTANSSGYHTPI
jgi:hypothetical protein